MDAITEMRRLGDRIEARCVGIEHSIGPVLTASVSATIYEEPVFFDEEPVFLDEGPIFDKEPPPSVEELIFLHGPVFDEEPVFVEEPVFDMEFDAGPIFDDETDDFTTAGYDVVYFDEEFDDFTTVGCGVVLFNGPDISTTMVGHNSTASMRQAAMTSSIHKDLVLESGLVAAPLSVLAVAPSNNYINAPSTCSTKCPSCALNVMASAAVHTIPEEDVVVIPNKPGVTLDVGAAASLVIAGMATDEVVVPKSRAAMELAIPLSTRCSTKCPGRAIVAVAALAPTMVLEILCDRAKIHPLPWPFFTSSDAGSRSWDVSFVWKPPWSLHYQQSIRFVPAAAFRLFVEGMTVMSVSSVGCAAISVHSDICSETSIVVHELIPWLEWAVIEELVQRKCGASCRFFLIKGCQVEIIGDDPDCCVSVSLQLHCSVSYASLCGPACGLEFVNWNYLVQLFNNAYKSIVHYQRQSRLYPKLWKPPWKLFAVVQVINYGKPGEQGAYSSRGMVMIILYLTWLLERASVSWVDLCHWSKFRSRIQELSICSYLSWDSGNPLYHGCIVARVNTVGCICSRALVHELLSAAFFMSALLFSQSNARVFQVFKHCAELKFSSEFRGEAENYQAYGELQIIVSCAKLQSRNNQVSSVNFKDCQVTELCGFKSSVVWDDDMSQDCGLRQDLLEELVECGQNLAGDNLKSLAVLDQPTDVEAEQFMFGDLLGANESAHKTLDEAPCQVVWDNNVPEPCEDVDMLANLDQHDDLQQQIALVSLVVVSIIAAKIGFDNVLIPNGENSSNADGSSLYPVQEDVINLKLRLVKYELGVACYLLLGGFSPWSMVTQLALDKDVAWSFGCFSSEGNEQLLEMYRMARRQWDPGIHNSNHENSHDCLACILLSKWAIRNEHRGVSDTNHSVVWGQATFRRAGSVTLGPCVTLWAFVLPRTSPTQSRSDNISCINRQAALERGHTRKYQNRVHPYRWLSSSRRIDSGSCSSASLGGDALSRAHVPVVACRWPRAVTLSDS